jgi:SNF2 family DNA or RNA helicase
LFFFLCLEQAAAAMAEGLTEASGKLRVLDRLLLRLLPRDHRVVIFAQNTSTLDVLERFCNERRYSHVRLDGATNRVQRNLNISQFNATDQKKIFLCSTRAGGLGITLTSADNVVLYDSDFNPQVDRQAIDRVHRIGQTRPVVAWRLLSRGSVEERIAQRAADKLGCAAQPTQPIHTISPPSSCAP